MEPTTKRDVAEALVFLAALAAILTALVLWLTSCAPPRVLQRQMERDIMAKGVARLLLDDPAVFAAACADASADSAATCPE